MSSVLDKNRQLILSSAAQFGPFLPKQTLEQRLKSVCVPRLWGDKLLALHSAEGKITAFIRKALWKRDTEKRWRSIFQAALHENSLLEGQGSALSVQQQSELYALKRSHAKAVVSDAAAAAESLGVSLSTKSTKAQLPFAVAVSPKYRSSLLAALPSDAAAQKGMDSALFETLLNPQQRSRAPLSALLAFASRYLRQTLSAVPPDVAGQTASLLDRAWQTEEKLQQIVTAGKAGSSESARHALRQLAESTLEDLLKMPTGQKRLIFAGTPARPTNLKLPVKWAGALLAETDTIFGKGVIDADLLQKTSSFIEQVHLSGLSFDIFSGFNPEIIAKLKAVVPQSGPAAIKNILREGLIGHFLPRLQTSLKKNDSPLWKKIALAPAEKLRSGMEYVVSFYTQQLSQGVVDALPEGMAMAIRQAILEGNFGKKLEEEFKKLAGAKLAEIRQALNGAFTDLTYDLPEQVPSLISLAGLGELGAAEQPLWIEVTKESDGSFSLAAFASGAALESLRPLPISEKGEKYLVPLLYKGLTAKQLDREFFFTLFAYKVFPQWDASYFATLAELQLALLAPLSEAQVTADANPVLYSATAHLAHGYWGILQAFLPQSLHLKASAQQSSFWFGWQKLALLDMWTQVKSKPDSLRQDSFRKVMHAGATTLARSAADVFEAGGLPVEQLRAIYDTTQEAIEAVEKIDLNPVGDEPKAPVMPPELRQILRTILGKWDLSPYLVEGLKDIASRALGKAAEKAIGDIAQELAIEAAKLPKRESIGKLLGRSIGLPLWPPAHDPLRKIWRVARLGLLVLNMARSLSLWVASVAKRIFLNALIWCFPGPLRSLERAARRLFAWACVRLVLTKAQIDGFLKLMQQYSQQVSRSEKLGYELPGTIPAYRGRSFQFVTANGQAVTTPVATTGGISAASSPSDLAPKKLFQAAADKSAEVAAVNGLFDIPVVPLVVSITSENALKQMREWLEKVKGVPGLFKGNAFRYLNRAMRNLPVPLPGGRDDLWSHIGDERACMEELAHLALFLYMHKPHEHISHEETNLVTVNLATVYAILDKLARRCPESQLDGYAVTPWALAFWKSSLQRRLLDSQTAAQMQRVCTYFGIDPLKEYSDKEIDGAARHSLFYTPHRNLKFDARLVITETSCGSPLETQYYKQLITHPAIAVKLECLLGKNASMIEKLTTLYCDRALKSWEKDGKKIDTAHGQVALEKLFGEEVDGVKRNPRMGVLPRPFYLLRVMNAFMNGALENTFEQNLSSSRASFDLDAYEFSEKTDSVPTVPPNKLVEVFRSLFSRPISYKAWRSSHTPSRQYTLPYRLDKQKWVMSGQVSDFDLHNLRDLYYGSHSRQTVSFEHLLDAHLNNKTSISSKVVNAPQTFIQGVKRGDGFFKSLGMDIDCFGFHASEDSFFSDFSTQERIEIELIWIQKADRIARLTSFLAEHPQKLAHSEMRTFLDWILLHYGALEQQLQEAPGFSRALGQFFEQALAMHSGHAEVALDLMRIGILAQLKCEKAQPGASRNFPAFRALILQMPHLSAKAQCAHDRANLLCLLHLMQDPATASDDLRRQVIEDLCWALGHLAKFPLDVFGEIGLEIDELRHLALDVQWLWAPTLAKVFEDNAPLRNRLLTSLAIEAGYFTKDNAQAVWEGRYPRYQCGPVSLQLLKSHTKRAIEKVSFQQDEKQTRQLSAYLQEIFGPTAPPLGRFQSGEYTFPLHNMHIEFLPKKQIWRFYRSEAGSKYYWVKPSDMTSQEATEHLTYWMEDSSAPHKRLLTLEKGKLKASTFAVANLPENGEGAALWKSQAFSLVNQAEIDHAQLLEPVDLSVMPHSLGPLAWFQPLSTIKAFADIKTPQVLAKIKLEALKIAFEIQVVQGERQAVCRDFLPGFFIAKEQRPSAYASALSPYASYLLLHNARGEQRILLTADALRAAFLSGMLKRFFKISTSAFMEMQLGNYLRHYLVKEDSGSKTINGQPSAAHALFYTYELDGQGRLTSSHSEAIIHLMCYHLAQGSLKSSLYYMEMLEGMGRKEAYTKPVLHTLALLDVALVLSGDLEHARMGLRLFAIREENRSLQAGDSAHDGVEAELSLLSWAAIQATYSRFYRDGALKKSPSQVEVTEYHELFTLKGIAHKNKHLLQTRRSTLSKAISDGSSFLGSVLERLSSLEMDSIAQNLLMLPNIAERYIFLEKKYALPGERSSRGMEDFLQELVRGKTLLNLDSIDSKGRGAASLLGKVTGWLNRPVLHGRESNFKALFAELQRSSCTPLPLESLPVHLFEVTPVLIRQHFPLYYRLARREIPMCSLDAPAEQKLFHKLFEKKADAFLRTLRFFNGKSAHPQDALMLMSLLFIAKSGPPRNSPSALKLEMLWIELNREEKKILTLDKSAQESVLQAKAGLQKKMDAWISSYNREYATLVNLAPETVAVAQQAFKRYKEHAWSSTLTQLAINGTVWAVTGSSLGPVARIAAAWCWKGMKVRHAVQQKNLLCAQEAQSLEDASQVSDGPLSKKLQSQLERMDRALGMFFSALLDKHFVQDKSVSDSSANNSTGLAAEPQSVSIASQSPLEGILQINQSLKDYHARPKVSAQTYSLKGAADLFALQEALEKAVFQMESEIVSERAAIESLVNCHRHANRGENAAKSGDGLALAKRMKAPRLQRQPTQDFAQIFAAFIRGEGENAPAGEDSLLHQQKLQLMLYTHLIKITRLHQVQRCRQLSDKLLSAMQEIAPTKRALGLAELVSELSRTRAYSFEGASGRAIRGYLAFEYKMGMMLWEKQVSQYARMLHGDDPQVVLELIPGSGKTIFGSPTTGYFAADGKQAVVNIFPKALAQTNIQQAFYQAKELFCQDSSSVRFTRNKSLSEGDLWAYLRWLQRAIYRREPINMTKEDFQALELRFIESLDKGARGVQDAPSKRQLFAFAKLLQKFRLASKGNVDEPHLIFKRNDELNHPIGSKQSVPNSFVRIIQECVGCLTACPEIARLLQIQENGQCYVSEELYRREIMFRVAEWMSRYTPLCIDEPHRADFVQYVCGTYARGIPDFVAASSKRGEIGLVVGLICHILPKAIGKGKAVGVAYGPSKRRGGVNSSAHTRGVVSLRNRPRSKIPMKHLPKPFSPCCICA